MCEKYSRKNAERGERSRARADRKKNKENSQTASKCVDDDETGRKGNAKGSFMQHFRKTGRRRRERVI